ncbi:putative Xaa-Pro aminopeptidase [Aulographum hederae CBS 113979]|uniref:Xaa-Pro aminopeptidase n=1 Tax=Aulographum hederae CBS 113979 TaxID=1176131 RepID=A0A6G1H2L6_9PEZI|nr:putative Xaa-Pro aminopeptidase [Aulographum hederae CBS 113979]
MAIELEDILKGKYPAKEHARRVAQWIEENGGDGKGIVYLEGQKEKMIEDNDGPVPFRQRRPFFYLTGCQLADCYFTYDIAEDKSTLFIPPIDPEDVIWSGLPVMPEEAMKKYDVDAVLPSTEVAPMLASKENASKTVYAMSGDNQVSDKITFMSFSTKNFSLLRPAVETTRVIKDDFEIAMLRHANRISTVAHIALMKAAATSSNEREMEALFLKSCMERGLHEQAYHPIMASGTAAATLHYVHNDRPMNSDTGKLNLLVDAGAEYRCYAADITRTFPISGSFSKESRQIYNLVLRMQKECIERLKAGVLWDSVHEHAHRVAIAGLLDLGILKGDAEEIFKARTSVAFFPHGLGHYLGMDTHDTGGNPNYADEDKMFRYLRVRGKLPAGSVITVEPGVYFCRFIIEPYLEDPEQKRYIDEKVLERYWEVGGVRIEDDVLVTETGYEDLTDTPKEPEELEKIVKGE